MKNKNKCKKNNKTDDKKVIKKIVPVNIHVNGLVKGSLFDKWYYNK